jgi:AGCS family alanine or glycine:cation symporter
MISWSYYGLNGFRYLFGKWFGYRKVSKNLYLSSLVYYLIFLTFIVVGSASSLGAVVDFSDFMILSMAFPNILGLIILAPEVKKDLEEIYARH